MRNILFIIPQSNNKNAEYKNIIGNSSTSAMIATFIEQEEDISELERIEDLIRKRMKELEEAQ